MTDQELIEFQRQHIQKLEEWGQLILEHCKATQALNRALLEKLDAWKKQCDKLEELNKKASEQLVSIQTLLLLNGPVGAI